MPPAHIKRERDVKIPTWRRQASNSKKNGMLERIVFNAKLLYKCARKELPEARCHFGPQETRAVGLNFGGAGWHLDAIKLTSTEPPKNKKLSCRSAHLPAFP